MLRLLLSLLFGLAGLTGCAAIPPEPSSAAGSSTLSIVGVTVIPMTTPTATLSDRTVLIRNGRIAAIAPRSSFKPPPGSRIIDGKGRYLMPGLADMHVHLE
jgi:imidazolonepropionase-like amidohydrolase